MTVAEASTRAPEPARDAAVASAPPDESPAVDAGSPRPRAPHRSDVNGDGVDDLLLAAPWRGARPGEDTRGVLYVYAGASGGVRARAPTQSLQAPRGAAMFGVDVRAVGDVHGDGFDDVAVTSTDGRVESRMKVFLCAGGSDGLSSHRVTRVSGVSIRAARGAVIASGDFDGDGLSDVLLGERDGALWRLAGTATGLAPPVAVPLPPTVRDVLVRDLDGDGRDDVVAVTRDAAHALWGDATPFDPARSVTAPMAVAAGRELLDDGTRVWIVARDRARCVWSSARVTRDGLRVEPSVTTPRRGCATRAVPDREGDALLLRDDDLDRLYVCARCIGQPRPSWRAVAHRVARFEEVLSVGDYDGDGLRDVAFGRDGEFAQPDRAVLLYGGPDGLTRATALATPLGETAP